MSFISNVILLCLCAFLCLTLSGFFSSYYVYTLQIIFGDQQTTNIMTLAYVLQGLFDHHRLLQKPQTYNVLNKL